MSARSNRVRRVRVACAFAGVMVMLGACGYPQPGFDAGRTSNNVFERVIGPENVATLTPSWTVTGAQVTGGRVVQSGRVIAASEAGIRAFDASTGGALWKVPAGDPPADVRYTVLGTGQVPGTGDVVYVGVGPRLGSFAPKTGSVSAYDSRTGAPVWSKGWGGAASAAALIDGRGFVFVQRALGDASDFTGIVAFDPSTGAVQFRVPDAGAGLAAVPGTLFALASGRLDAIPTGGCGAATCRAVWHGDYTPYNRAIVVAADDRAFVGTNLGLTVFAAGGCGGSACAPVWTAAGDFVGGLAVGGGRIYASPDWIHPQPGLPTLRMFASTGCGAPTCTALWRSAEARWFGPPSIANGVVYTTTHSGPTQAWPAAGCGQPLCPPLWTTDQEVQATTSPIVADGRLYTGWEDIETFRLPL